MNSVVRFLVQLSANGGNVLSVARQTQNQLDRISSKAGRVKKALHDAFSFSSLSSSLMSIPGMQFLLNPYTLLAGGIGAVTKLGAEAEKTTVAFTTLVGSQEKAKNMLKEIADFAAATPFGKLELTQNAQTMLNFGVETNKVMEYLQQLGDISGGDAERLSSLSLVFGQVKAAGKLAGQDLLQFINAGFNPLKELQSMTGKSYQELQEMMSKGQITVDNVAQAIAHATGEGGKFHGMMLNLSTTVQGQWSTAIGNLQEMAAQLFTKIQPFIVMLLGAFNRFLPILKTSLMAVFTIINWIIDKIIEWKDVLLVLATVIGTVTIVLQAKNIALGVYALLQSGITLATSAWTVAQNALNIALMANPIGLVIALVAGLIAAVILCWNKFAGFRAFILTMWDVIKGFGGILKTFIIDRITEMLSAIGDVGKALAKLFKGDFSGAWNSVKDATIKLSGKNSITKLVDSSKTVFQSVKDGYTHHLQEEKSKSNKSTSQKTGITAPSLKGSSEKVIFGSANTSSKKKKGKNSHAAQAIATGGQRNTSIHVNIGKFFDYINVHMMEKTDTAELQRIILEVLNRALAIATTSDR